MTIQFQEWPKISRLFRDIVVTEKIDGTNAAIGVVPLTGEDLMTAPDDSIIVTGDNGSLADAKIVYAQSRTRLITPGQDNFGFAKWVEDNAILLAETLGDGLHHGEWWGSGIQRGYGLEKGEKRFSLFNTPRYGDESKFNLAALKDIGVATVPVLYEGLFSEWEIKNCLDQLERQGSQAAPGFMNPEGVIVFHVAAQTPFKVTLKNDEKPKGSKE